MDYDERGELIGHISIGLELGGIRCGENFPRQWRWRGKNLTPPSRRRAFAPAAFGLVRTMASNSSGRRLIPKTPGKSNLALHYIDNLDARLEMFAAGY